MPPSNIFIYYHAYCQDGIASAWSLYCNGMNDATFSPSNAGKDVRIFDYPNNSTLYFVDVCPLIRQLRYIAELKTVEKIIIIDHHKINTDEISTVDKVKLIHSIDNSACVLVYKYLNPEREVPKLLQYIEDRDLWRFKLKNSKIICEAIYVNLKDAVCLYNKHEVDRAFKTVSYHVEKLEEDTTAYEKEGEERLKMAEIMIGMLVEGSQPATFQFGEHKYNIWQVNTRLYRSEVGNALLERKFPDGTECDFALCWHYDIRSMNFWLSLRSNDKKVNVQKVAKALGGGGHAGAAGAEIDVKQFQTYLKLKK